MTSLEKAKKIAFILDDKKANDINVVKIEAISPIADYFVIATGTSNTHVRSLADEVEEKLKKENDTPPTRIEGYRSNSWILIDYDNVIVHIFTKEGREFYDLDRLWADGEKLALDFVPETSVPDTSIEE